MKDSVDCLGFNTLRQGEISAFPAAALLTITRAADRVTVVQQ